MQFYYLINWHDTIEYIKMQASTRLSFCEFHTIKPLDNFPLICTDMYKSFIYTEADIEIIVYGNRIPMLKWHGLL